MPAVLSAQALDEIGYTALLAELGDATPNGTGVSVTQVEAPLANGQFAPNAADAEFAGKTFNVISEPAAVASNHATTVGRAFYGLTSSPASGITDINVYSVNPYLQEDLLGFGGLDPLVETQDIQNHSWIGTLDLVDQNVNAIQRLDFVINRDDVTVVAALNNGDATPVPSLLANSFNSIITGVTDGDHSSGRADIEFPVRQVPHIVAPSDFTSFSNPLISGGAAVLLETARADEALNNADRNEVVRSLLLAGATKDEFASWSNTPTQPLDEQYGTGELHIQRSYHILTAGQQTPSDDASVIDSMGWDLRTVDATGSETYFFDVPDGGTIEEFSAVLTWNREVTDTVASQVFVPSYTGLNDLDLHLYSVDGSTLDTVLLESIGAGNVEHIYVNDALGIGTPLTGGRYALVVEGGINPQEYALSWFSRFARLDCDFDGDGICDLTDLAGLYANIGTTEALYDVDGNGTVDAADISPWLSAASVEANPFNADNLTFVTGDLNFDGTVNSSDLGLLLNNFSATDEVQYGGGDLNGDGEINSTDLGLLLNNFGFSSLPQQAASASAVPEPSNFGWVLLVFAALAVRRRR